MPGFERIFAAYEHGLQQLADELIAEFDPPDQERIHLLLVSHLAQAVVRTYEAFQLGAGGPGLDATTSIMYASSTQPGRRVLNVPLRTLVDNSTLSGLEARMLAGFLNLKRTIVISGGPNMGKSTLLNALLEMLPRDQRLVVVDDDDDELPALRDRSFTVQLRAGRGTAARSDVFKKAAGMKPTWVVAGELAQRDGPAFFSALDQGTSGLATVQTPDPALVLTDWLSASRGMPALLTASRPLFVHIDRDSGGRPRVQSIAETTVDAGKPALTPYRMGQIQAPPAELTEHPAAKPPPE